MGQLPLQLVEGLFIKVFHDTSSGLLLTSDPEMHHLGKETEKILNEIWGPTSTQNPNCEDLKWLIFFVVTGIAGIVLGHGMFHRNQSTEHFPSF